MMETNLDQSNIKWEDSDSEFFLKYGKAFIPDRDKLERLFIDLIERDTQEAFTVVDICVGGGWLTEAILKKYPRANVIALDGSSQMLDYTRKRLTAFKDRVVYKKFDLLENDWIKQLGTVDYFVSSLAIHHLDDHGKELLFKDLYQVLNRDGKIVIADLVKPESEATRLIAAREWNEIVQEQSKKFYGNNKAYEFFRDEQWNLFYYPDDPIDKPSTLFEQLKWLKQAGFKNVETLFYRAGHTLFCGIKSSEKEF